MVEAGVTMPARNGRLLPISQDRVEFTRSEAEYIFVFQATLSRASTKFTSRRQRCVFETSCCSSSFGVQTTSLRYALSGGRHLRYRRHRGLHEPIVVANPIAARTWRGRS